MPQIHATYGGSRGYHYNIQLYDYQRTQIDAMTQFRIQVDRINRQNNWPPIQWDRLVIETDAVDPDRIYIIDPQAVRTTRPQSLAEALARGQRMEFSGQAGIWLGTPAEALRPSNSQEAMYGPPPGGA